MDIRGVINNAGIWQKKNQLDSIRQEEILSVINTNLTGLILLTRGLLPIIRKCNNPFVINISSRSGDSAQAGQSVYSATKYGVKGFTEVLREDLIDKGAPWAFSELLPLAKNFISIILQLILNYILKYITQY